MVKMRTKDARLVATLLEALDVIPKAKRALSDKPVKGPVLEYDAVWLELTATEMMDGEGQGGAHYFYVPAEIGQSILDAASNVIRKKLAELAMEIVRR